MRAEFSFTGHIPPSKSMLIRFLLASAYGSNAMDTQCSDCDDVRSMQQALEAFKKCDNTIHCGRAALVFRLMAGLASRTKGNFLITGHESLLARPHDKLNSFLGQLGVDCKWSSNKGLRLNSKGWQKPSMPVMLDMSVSSQFASSAVLNAWDLDFPLELILSKEKVSTGYFEMTVKIARALGMRIEKIKKGSDNSIRIPAYQKVKGYDVMIEPDMSSAFSVAALGALAGEARILGFPTKSIQPDSGFVRVLEEMGCQVLFSDGALIVRKTKRLDHIELNIRDMPDLFPVLSVLCSFASGVSKISGAPHLAHKESNRLLKTAELISLIGRKAALCPDGIIIEGKPLDNLNDNSKTARHFDFNPADDHRMAMAALIAKRAGINCSIINPQAVKKSYPEFLSIKGEEARP